MSVQTVYIDIIIIKVKPKVVKKGKAGRRKLIKPEVTYNIGFSLYGTNGQESRPGAEVIEILWRVMCTNDVPQKGEGRHIVHGNGAKYQHQKCL